MNLLFTGRGGSGSWHIRGKQLGDALGATVKPHAARADFAACDAAVIVKRVPTGLLSELRASGKPWVYDIVDAFPQPASSAWDRAEAIGWVRRQIAALDPTAILWPNRKMREDCDDGRPGFVLPHHARPQQAPNPIRDKVRRVGYEGRADYLQGWAQTIERECERRGWTFAVNPTQLADLDIVVAFRGGKWDGYASQCYKSAVKLTNAHGSGTPFVGRPDAGYAEMASGAEYWATTPAEIKTAFDWLEPKSTREQVSDRFRDAAYTLDRAVTDLRPFLESAC